VRGEHSPRSYDTMFERWAVGYRAQARFAAYMAERYGIYPPGRSADPIRAVHLTTTRSACLQPVQGFVAVFLGPIGSKYQSDTSLATASLRRMAGVPPRCLAISSTAGRLSVSIPYNAM
jgi:hypothetical protein